MKSDKLFIPFIILFISWQICAGQTESKLIDEFGAITGDDLQGRVFHFQNILKKNKVRGYVVLYGDKKYPIATYINERRIQGCLLMLKYENFDANNLSFIFTNDKAEVGGQFWLAAKADQKPVSNEIPHDYKLTNLTKPLMLDKKSYEDNDYCPFRFDLQFYSRFLKASPNVVGKIIIFEKSIKKYQREKLKYFRQLTRKEKVSPKQVKFVRGKYDSQSDAEFWLVPVRRK